jgi:hypothetical protein
MNNTEGSTSNSKATGRRNSSSDDNMADLIKQFTTALADNNKFTRIKEPITYNGVRDALVIESWVRSVERYTLFQNWDSERSCLFATTLLRDRADAWFRTIENTDEAPTTWLELKRLLIEFFKPDNSVRIARDKLAVLSQTGDLVDYINTFMDIKLAIPGMTDDESCDKFIRGLSSKAMRAHVRQYEADTLKLAIQSALSYDSAQREDDYIPTQQQTRVKQQQRSYIDDPMDIDTMEDLYVMNNRRNNNSNGSTRRFINNNYRNNIRRNNNDEGCFYCGKQGHLKRNCRTRINDIRRLDDQQAQRRKKDFRHM